MKPPPLMFSWEIYKSFKTAEAATGGALKKGLQRVKKRIQHRCFPVNIAKFLKTPIMKNICEQLLPEKLF